MCVCVCVCVCDGLNNAPFWVFSSLPNMRYDDMAGARCPLVWVDFLDQGGCHDMLCFPWGTINCEVVGDLPNRMPPLVT